MASIPLKRPEEMTLAEWMERHGYGLRSLGRLADVDPSSLFNYRNGNYAPGADNLRKLAAAMGISADTVLRMFENGKGGSRHV